MFLLLQIFKQIHVLVVANFTQILKSVKRPPAICKSFLCQKEINKKKYKFNNLSINQLTYKCTSNSTWKLWIEKDAGDLPEANPTAHKSKRAKKSSFQRCRSWVTEQTISQEHCRNCRTRQDKISLSRPLQQNLDKHKQSLKITITDKRETGKKTKPISQDHHHDCRFSWSTKEESGTTCEP